MKLYFFIISLSFIRTITLAQSFDDPAKFFPAKAGNMWEYFYYDTPYTDTLQNIVYKDSIDENNTIYSWQNSSFINPSQVLDNRLYWIDTLFQVHGHYVDSTAMLYKLDANKGDQWVIKRYNQAAFEIVRVDTVYEENLFGVNTLIKNYRNYFTNDSSATTGLDRDVIFLAYNIGLVTWVGLEGQGSFMLKGAVIDSILYGDTTQTITSVFDLNTSSNFESFNISQNFPNPFNPVTKITYNLATMDRVSLKIYDILGREVTTLVNEEKPVGKYEVNFNASHLASGVYFYKLQTGNFVETKKMLFLK